MTSKGFYLVSGPEVPEHIIESAVRPKMWGEGGAITWCTSPYPTERELREALEILDSPCRECGGLVSRRVMSPLKARLEALNICQNCEFWTRIVSEGAWVVGGEAFNVGDESSRGGFRGFGGARFVLLHEDGRRVATTNLWCLGRVPAHFRDRLPNNATFEQVGRYAHD